MTTQQMQLALEAKLEYIRENADNIFDELIIKVRHSIGTNPAYNLALVSDLKTAGSKKRTGLSSAVLRKQFLLSLIDGTLTEGWPEKELLGTLIKVLYDIG